MMDKFSTFTFGVHRHYIYLHRDNQKSFHMMDKFSTFTFGVHRQYIYLHSDNQKSFHDD